MTATAEARPAGRARGREALSIALVSAAVTGVYVAVGIGFFDPIGYYDPWIYTATMWNLDFVLDFFGHTYYPSRLPWLIPGYALNQVLPADVAFVALHAVFALGGALAAYSIVRRFYGADAALATYGFLVGGTFFLSAYSTDYPDGAGVTFLLSALACVVAAWQSRRRTLWLVAAGFFMAAAVGTNLFSSVFVLGIVGVYAVVALPDLRARRVARIARDIAAAVVGAASLVVACGSFSAAHGREFLFFMPSVRALSAIDPSDYQLPASWVLHEPRLLVLPVLLVCVPLAWRGLSRRGGAERRFAIGSVAFLGYLALTLSVWDFAGDGVFLQTSYYFTLLLTAVAPVFGVVVAGLARRAELEGSRLAAVVTLATALPVVLVFGLDIESLVGRLGAAITLALCLVAVAGVAAAPRVGRRARVYATVATLSLALSFAHASSSTTTSAIGTPARANHDALRIGEQLVGFLQDHDLQETPPAFWIDSGDPLSNSLASLYLYLYSTAGLALPRVDAELERRLGELRPATLVLVCPARECEDGEKALRRTGFQLRLHASTVLESGGLRRRIDAFALPGIRDPLSPSSQRLFYAPTASPPLRHGRSGRAVRAWSLAGGLPRGWSTADGSSVSREAGAMVLETTERPWNYELVSTTLALGPGRYRVVLDGSVRRGGLDLGVLDLERDEWLTQAFFWSGQRFGGRRMTTTLRLSRPTRVRVVLSNWVPVPFASRWAVRSLSLERLAR